MEQAGTIDPVGHWAHPPLDGLEQLDFKEVMQWLHRVWRENGVEKEPGDYVSCFDPKDEAAVAIERRHGRNMEEEQLVYAIADGIVGEDMFPEWVEGTHANMVVLLRAMCRRDLRRGRWKVKPKLWRGLGKFFRFLAFWKRPGARQTRPRLLPQSTSIPS